MHRINTLEVPGDFCAAETWLYTKPRRSDVVLRLFGLHRQSTQFFSSLPSRKLLRGEVWFSLRTGSVRIIFSFPSLREGVFSVLAHQPSTGISFPFDYRTLLTGLFTDILVIRLTLSFLLL